MCFKIMFCTMFLLMMYISKYKIWAKTMSTRHLFLICHQFETFVTLVKIEVYSNMSSTPVSKISRFVYNSSYPCNSCWLIGDLTCHEMLCKKCTCIVQDVFVKHFIARARPHKNSAKIWVHFQSYMTHVIFKKFVKL